MKKKVVIILSIITLVVCFVFLVKGFLWYKTRVKEQNLFKLQNEAIENIIDSRRVKNVGGQVVDPFGEDKILQLLFIGLDVRVGQENGHCDAIQLITIDQNLTIVKITAVPRGTYSPLPLGKGTTSTDYYVSNACGLGGLDYGIKQIEKILGVKADYLITVNFSETMGILRNLQLPTTETLQWLRNRHGYAIGEPQRAHNHSTFIKQMLLKFLPTKKTVLDIPLQYLAYKSVKTDLTFAEVQSIVEVLSSFDLANHPEKIQLFMRPLYVVQDIAYDPEGINNYLDQTLGPIKNFLSKEDYSALSTETVQTKLLDIIKNNKNNLEFISWAYENNLWLQIEDREKRFFAQYDFLVSNLVLIPDTVERQSVIADYIVEMENRGESLWLEKAKVLLKQEIGY